MPSWFSPRQTAAQISRARRIAQVLIRNGLGFVVAITGMTRYLPPWQARAVGRGRRAPGPSVPQRLRRTLEELGPTFIKLGQILSTRPDLLPEDYILELIKLQDAAPPVPTSEIVTVIERELGAPLDSLYAEFAPDSIAAASIGQVHRARLHDGTDVVVKVQRPGVESAVQADLQLLQSQVRFLARRSEVLADYGLNDMAREFSNSLLAELDYRLEGRNADRLRELVRGDAVVLPTVIWDHTTKHVLTMTDLKGIKLSERETLLAAGHDLGHVARQVLDTYLTQVFVYGIFQADPHPGNILVCGDRIGLVDLGNVGYLTSAMRGHLGDLLFALIRQDADEMLHVIQSMGAMSVDADTSAMRQELQRLLVRYYDVSLETVPIAEFLREIMGLAFRHRVRLPTDLTLLARTVVVLEGVVRRLDPSIVLAKHLEPFIMRLLKERTSLRRLGLDAVKTLSDLRDVLHVLPGRVDMLTERLGRGELTIGIEVRRTEQILRRVEAVGNRISFSVVVAAIIVGSALILLGGEDATVFLLPFTDIVLPVPQLGFLVAGLLGAWWLFSIVRSKGL